ncbi:hypothetical protein CR513_45859, partial [Mucuna pruriens]
MQVNCNLIKPRNERNSRGGNPRISSDKISNSELNSLLSPNNTKTRPLHPLVSSSTGSFITILCKIQRPQHRASVTRPLNPPPRRNSIVNGTLHHHSPRILFPGSPQKRTIRVFHSRKIRARRYATLVNRKARVLSGVCSSVCENGVVAAAAGTAKHQAAALENGGGVAEDEVDGSVDVAFSVELA